MNKTLLLESREMMIERYKKQKWEEVFNSPTGSQENIKAFKDALTLANRIFPDEIGEDFYLQDLSGGQHKCNGGCYSNCY